MVVSNNRNFHHKGNRDEIVEFIYRHPNFQICYKAVFSTINFNCAYSKRPFSDVLKRVALRNFSTGKPPDPHLSSIPLPK